MCTQHSQESLESTEVVNLEIKWTKREAEVLAQVYPAFSTDEDLTDNQLEDIYEAVTDCLGAGEYGYNLQGEPDAKASTIEDIISRLIPPMRERGLLN